MKGLEVTEKDGKQKTKPVSFGGSGFLDRLRARSISFGRNRQTAKQLERIAYALEHLVRLKDFEFKPIAEQRREAWEEREKARKSSNR